MDGPSLTRSQTLAIGAVLAAAQRSNAPLRRPSVTSPPYWGMPINLTITRPIPVSALPPYQWQTIITVPTRVGYFAILSGIIATTYTPLATSGVTFRLVQGIQVLNTLQLNTGVELNRSGNYPLYPRKLRIATPTDEALSLQAANTSGLQRYVFAGLFGYYANAPDASTLDTGGLTDVK